MNWCAAHHKRKRKREWKKGRSTFGATRETQKSHTHKHKHNLEICVVVILNHAHSSRSIFGNTYTQSYSHIDEWKSVSDQTSKYKCVLCSRDIEFIFFVAAKMNKYEKHSDEFPNKLVCHWIEIEINNKTFFPSFSSFVNIKHVDVVLGILFCLTGMLVWVCIHDSISNVVVVGGGVAHSSSRKILIAFRASMCKVKNVFYFFCQFSYYFSSDNWMRWKLFWGAFNQLTLKSEAM